MSGMDWAGTLLKYRMAWIAAGIALGHAVLLGAALLMPISIDSAPSTPQLIIELADMVELAPAPEPEQPVASAPLLDPAPDAAPPEPANVPETIAPEPNTAAPLPVLTSEFGQDALPAPPVHQTPEPPPATADQVASVLRRAKCQTPLKYQQEDCPPPDPFALAEARQAAQNAREAALDAGLPPPNVLETLFSQNQRTYRRPGMKSAPDGSTVTFVRPDEDLFTDPMAPGAYNAQRIRDGKAPLLDRELERDLRNARRD